jgi:hypothetical protein
LLNWTDPHGPSLCSNSFQNGLPNGKLVSELKSMAVCSLVVIHGCYRRVRSYLLKRHLDLASIISTKTNRTELTGWRLFQTMILPPAVFVPVPSNMRLS